MLSPYRLCVLLVLLFSTTAHAALFNSDAPIFRERDCFTGPFASYDSWLQTMTKKYERKYAKDNEADRAEKIVKDMQRFQAVFSKAAFETYVHSST